MLTWVRWNDPKNLPMLLVRLLAAELLIGVFRIENECPRPLIISLNGCLSFPRRHHARSTRISKVSPDRKRTYGDAHDTFVVDQDFVISIPLLARSLAIRQRRDDIVQKLVPLLDLARLGDHFQSAAVLAPTPSESTTHTFRMEVTDDDRVSGPDLDQEREECAARAAGPARGEAAMLPVGPAGHGRTPRIPWVLPIASVGGELA